jgi:hypothetical protein
MRRAILLAAAAVLAAQEAPAPLAQALPPGTRQVILLRAPALASLKLQALQARLKGRASALALLGPELALPQVPKPAGGVARVSLDKGAVLLVATDAAALAERLGALPAGEGWRFYVQGRGHLLGSRRGWSVVAEEARQAAWTEALKPGQAPPVMPLDEALQTGDLAGWNLHGARVAEVLDALSPFPVPEAFQRLLGAALADSRDAAFSLALDASGDATLTVSGRPKPGQEALFLRLGRAEAFGLAGLPARPWAAALGGFLPPRWLDAFPEPKAWRPGKLPPALARALDAAQREVVGFGALRPAQPEPEALRLDARDRDLLRDALARAVSEAPVPEAGGDKVPLSALEVGSHEGLRAFTLSLPDAEAGPGAERSTLFLEAGDRSWRLSPGPGAPPPSEGSLSDDEALREAATRVPAGAAFYAFEHPRAAWLAEARRLNEEREGLDPDLREQCPEEPEPPEAPPFALAVAFEADRWTITCSLPAATQLALVQRDTTRVKGRLSARQKALDAQQGRLARSKQ